MSRHLLARRLAGLAASAACSSSSGSSTAEALHHAAAAAGPSAAAAAAFFSNQPFSAWPAQLRLCGLRTFASSSSTSSSGGLLIARGWAATARCSSSILSISSSSTLNNNISTAAAVGAQLHVTRGLLGLARTRPARVNYQDHNQTKPKRLKIKTRSVVKRRVIVAKDGTMWRTQAGRRHKRTKKSGGRLRELRGLAPLADGWARKLRKLGYKRRWWYSEKA